MKAENMPKEKIQQHGTYVKIDSFNIPKLLN